MGMYWWTELFYGRLISVDSVARLKAAGEDVNVINAYLHTFADDAGRCILRPPGCLVRIGSMDPVLDEGDSANGFVSWEDLHRATRNVPGLIDAVERGPTAHEAATLGRLLRLAATNEALDTECMPGVYICEARWDTYGPGCHVTKNIRVR